MCCWAATNTNPHHPTRTTGAQEGVEAGPREALRAGRVRQAPRAARCVLVLLFLAVFNFYNWLSDVSLRHPSEFNSLKELNKIFFEDFFTVLILTDVLLLLISFLYTQTFHHVMRNSGFIISTVLIKMSFGQDGMAGSILNIAAVSIGLLFMYIYSRYEKIQASN